MDILTHAITGLIVASPFFSDAPLPAAGFVMGNVLPDLDAVSRLFGKRAFLRWHQTYTHSLPLIAMGCMMSWLGLGLFDSDLIVSMMLRETALALGVGMVLHSVLDLTNTFGVKLLTPLTPTRYCLESVFFVDSTYLLGCLVFGVWILSTWPTPPQAIAFSFVGGLLIFEAARYAMRAFAFRTSPTGTLALIPSSMWPWLYLGCRRKDNRIETYMLNGVTGKALEVESLAILDSEYGDVLQQAPEYATMLQLSNAYHLVQADLDAGELKLTCRDLRMTNFKTRFGQLQLWADPHSRQLLRTEFFV